MPFIYCQPETAQDLEAYYKLRWEILRKPLSQPLGSERDGLENSAIHVIAKDKKKIVGGGRIHFIDKKRAQIRFMFVREKYQNLGIGAEILLNLEKFAFNQGRTEIVLNAREPAIPFYERCGYKVISGAFDSLGITHYQMLKEKVI